MLPTLFDILSRSFFKFVVLGLYYFYTLTFQGSYQAYFTVSINSSQNFFILVVPILDTTRLK